MYTPWRPFDQSCKKNGWHYLPGSTWCWWIWFGNYLQIVQRKKPLFERKIARMHRRSARLQPLVSWVTRVTSTKKRNWRVRTMNARGYSKRERERRRRIALDEASIIRPYRLWPESGRQTQPESRCQRHLPTNGSIWRHEGTSPLYGHTVALSFVANLFTFGKFKVHHSRHLCPRRWTHSCSLAHPEVAASSFPTRNGSAERQAWRITYSDPNIHS